MTTLDMYWVNAERNFGDALGPIIVERLFNIRPSWVEPCRAALVSVGSILGILALQMREHGLKVPEVHVWGSGYISGRVPPIDVPQVIHHAVRGRRTQDFGTVGDDIAVGDPGLLSPFLIEAPVVKECEVGIVPHRMHKHDVELLKVKELWPKVKIIDVEDEPLEVVRQIASCEFLYSSSLHGLVVADSFGVPNQWVGFPGELIGDKWKFHDYYSAFGIESPVRLNFAESQVKTEAVLKLADEYVARSGLLEMQKSLVAAFPFTS